MTTIVVIEAVALGLLALLVAGLLRSHADILRILHDLGVTEESSTGAAPPLRLAAGVTAPAASGSRPAVDLAGVTPAGAAVHVSVAGVSHHTLLVFLSSGCAGCAGLWSELSAAAPAATPGGPRFVIVTKGPETESPSAVAELTPAGLTTVMSTAAFDGYSVAGTPYFVLVDGPSSRVVGEGSALTLRQIDNFVRRATADARAATRRGFDARRRDTDAELVAAGILPGDPRLHHRARGGAQ